MKKTMVSIEAKQKKDLMPWPKQIALGELVKKTAGAWKGEAGLKYQLKLRKEWERRDGLAALN